MTEELLQRVTAPTKTHCRLCNHERPAKQMPMLDIGSTPLANSFCATSVEAQQLPQFPLQVFACARCGHHQLGVVADANVMFTDYAYASGTSASFRKHFEDYAHEIRTRYPDVKRVVEIGSNDGTMMKALLGEKFQHVTGVEPAKNLADKCIAENLDVLNEFFNVSTVTHHKLSTYDFFVANNVLAHVDDFVGTLNALARTEARAGVFEVQYLGALLSSGTFDMIYHEHLDYWRLTELINELPVQTPWKVVDVDIVATHGGSLRVWVDRAHAKTGISSFARNLYNIELQRNWPAEWALLQRMMHEEKKRLWAQLGDEKRIAVFGAPAKLTSLLYGLGLTSLNFAYAVDDSPLKQGLFTPGLGLDVCKPQHIITDPPEAVLVGAWNFAKYIVPRVKEMRSGMNVIVPFEK